MSTVLVPPAAPPTRDDARLRRLLGTLLAALWAVSAAGAAWVGPWHATADALRADLAAHRVARWDVVREAPQHRLVALGLGTDVTAGPGPATIVEWRDTAGHARWTDVEGTGLVPGLDGLARDDGAVVSRDPTDDERAQRIRQWLGQRAPGRWGGAVPGWLSVAAGLLSLVTFVAVVWGPRPRYGTRWFWFWTTGLPAGLGSLALAVAEHLRRGPAHPGAPTPDGRDGRRSGWAGFGLALVGGLVARAVGAALAALLHLG